MTESERHERHAELIAALDGGEFIQLRQRAGWSRERVARHIGVSGISIRRWELRETAPRGDQADRMWELLGWLRTAPPVAKRSGRFDNKGSIVKRDTEAER